LLGLDTRTLLRKLYHEETLRLFEATALRFQCACSRERIAEVLRGLGREEVEAVLLEREAVVVACEFCGKQYSFDAVDAVGLFGVSGDAVHKPTLH
jgi:molecular chaperone Hsp33